MTLAPQALYSTRQAVASRNYFPGPIDVTDYTGIFERAAKRIDLIDPDGREASSLLKHLKMLDVQGKNR